jgi:hypothetical protein
LEGCRDQSRSDPVSLVGRFNGEWAEGNDLDETLTGVDPATTQLHVTNHVARSVGHEAGDHVPCRD